MVVRTLFVYLIVFTLMMMGANMAARKGKTIYILFSFLIFAIMMGIRYGVGTDHIAYYEDYLYNNSLRGETDLGYRNVQDFFRNLSMPPELFFGFIALIQIGLFFQPHKSNPKIFPYLIFSFFIGMTWMLFANTIRQGIACSIFVVAVYYLAKKRVVSYMLLILLASFFHSSALILIILYPLLTIKEEWFKNIKLQYVILAISLLFHGINLIGKYMDQYFLLIELANYEQYGEGNGYEHILTGEGRDLSWGLGAYLGLLQNIIIIYFSNKVKAACKSNYITIIYNLLFVGNMVVYAIPNSMLISRFMYYFTIFNSVFVAYTIQYLYHSRIYRYYYQIMALLVSMTFLGTLYKMKTNDSAYYTVWQKQEYRQEHMGIN